LYYRLNVLNIYLPPLRERREDIPLLVRRFIREFSALHDRPFHGVSAEAMGILVDYAWPGNVRQLRNLVESMVVLAPGREITADDIPAEVRTGSAYLPVHLPPVAVQAGEATAGGRELEFIVHSLVDLRLQVEELRRRVDQNTQRVIAAEQGGSAPVRPDVAALAVPAIEPPAPPPANVFTVTPGMTMAQIERGAIEAALRETNGNRRRAAELLGIGERTLYRKLREYDIPDGYAALA
jgi:DNA-binding NtrC family response regulator